MYLTPDSEPGIASSIESSFHLSKPSSDERTVGTFVMCVQSEAGVEVFSTGEGGRGRERERGGEGGEGREGCRRGREGRMEGRRG